MPDRSESKRLIGGPFDGGEVPRSTHSVLLSGDPIPDGQVARYVFVRAVDAYSFNGLDTVMVTIPMGGDDA